MTTDNVVFSYKDVNCLVGEVNGNADAVVGVQFTFVATRGDIVASNSMLFRYDQPAYTEEAPFLSFDEWKAQKLYPLLDVLVEAWKWKSDLIAKLDRQTVDQGLVMKPIEETITPPAAEETDAGDASTAS